MGASNSGRYARVNEEESTIQSGDAAPVRSPEDPTAPPGTQLGDESEHVHNRGRKRRADLAGSGADDHDMGAHDAHYRHSAPGAKPKLGEFLATAISGNDVLSSCLYTVGIVAVSGGVFAPVAMVLVVTMLYFFRNIYAEIGSAIPYNGGAYNVLLVTAIKPIALLAASLTLVSYLATGVVSAVEACHYLHSVSSEVPVVLSALLLLFIFCVLNLMGISESAFVASVIFCAHTITLLVLIAYSIVQMSRVGTTILLENASSAFQPSVAEAMFYGFSAATLGITGFETSANYIEEQKPGVFPKTLRNMWLVAVIFNPILSFLSVGVLRLSDLQAEGYKEVAMSKMALVSAGRWLEVWVSVDAFLVLSGSVITAYVGSTGLIRRLAQDGFMPPFLLEQNRWRLTNHWIVLLFFTICASLLLAVNGKIDDLGGVYSLAFLSVMLMFATGNILLKLNFDKEYADRSPQAHWVEVIIGLLFVGIALVVTVIRGPRYFLIFSLYLVAVGILIVMRFLVCNCGLPADSTEENDSRPPRDLEEHEPIVQHKAT